MAQDNDRMIFQKALVALAKVCRFELDTFLIKMIDEQVAQKFGYQRTTLAISKIIETRSSRDPFPSIQEIRRQMEPEADDRLKATELANKIISSISSRGYTWPQIVRGIGLDFQQTLEKEFSEAGRLAIRDLGGWAEVCKLADAGELNVFRAQLRDLIHCKLESIAAAGPQRQLEGFSNLLQSMP